MKIKHNVKYNYGTLNISKELIAQIKAYAAAHGIKMRFWSEQVLTAALEKKNGKSDCITFSLLTQNTIEKEDK